MVATHTTSFWNIIIQLTSHDDLTEKSVLAKPANKIMMVKKKTCWNGKKSKLHFVIWRKNCFHRILSRLRFCTNLQINLDAKGMDPLDLFISYQFLL